MNLLSRNVVEEENPPPEFDNITIATWKIDIVKKSIKCSVGFYQALGFEPEELECSFQSFIDSVIYHEDVPVLFDKIYSPLLTIPQIIEIRLFTKTGYQWFQVIIQKYVGHVNASLVNIHQLKLSGLQLSSKIEQYTSASKINQSGNWEIDVNKHLVLLSDETYEMFKLPRHDNFSIDDFIEYYVPEYRPVLAAAIDSSMLYGKPFNLDLQLKAPDKNAIWVKVKAIVVIDDFGKSTIIKGTILNIDLNKKKENDVKASLNLISHQNKRLQNFTYIVSHNLRSHASNLQILVNLYEKSKEQGDGQEIFSHIKTISNSLNTTIEHLNQIIKIETETGKQRQVIRFDTLFNNIVSTLERNVKDADAIVTHDFSQCPEVDYIPAYLESIFHNLLTNALKYRHPDRQPIINCQSRKEKNSTYIVFQDNGIGIDMERYGDKIFGMYQTFHDNSDSQGIGLFITRNQVEALGGFIHVDSTVNVGTTFNIKLT